LIPQEGKRTEGLRAGEGDPAQMELRTFVSAKGGPGTAVAKVQRSLDATGKNGSPLKGALDIDVRGASAAVGSPLVNAEGQVLGIFVRACRDASGASPCPPSLLGAPVAALREFLRSTPAHAVVPPVHLGIVGTPEPPSAPLRGVRVQEVAPGSPADKAGLKAGVDVIVAADSRPVPSPEKLAALLSNRGVGDRIKLLVLGPELLREVVIVLESPKPSVEKPEGKAQTPAKS
jgi:serine protease Do